MNRSPLEKASWIAGVVSAAVAVWVLLFPSSNSAEKSFATPPSQSQTSVSERTNTAVPKIGATVTPTPTVIFRPLAGACPTREAIQSTKKQAGGLSSYGARDEAYNILVEDALCIGDLQLAAELAGSLSSYNGRDVAHAKVLDSAISSNNMELAEKLAASMSSYAARDDARRKIINSLRERGANPSIHSDAAR